MPTKLTDDRILDLARTVALRDWSAPRGHSSRAIQGKRDMAWSDAEAREDDAWARYEMYVGRQQQFLNKLEAETPEDFARRRGKETRNLTAAIVDIKSALYDRPPVRKVVDLEGEEGEPSADIEAIQDRLAEVWSSPEGAMNEVLKLADRMAYLTGLVAIRPWYQAERRCVRFQLWLKHRIRIVENPDDPSHPLAIVFRWPACDPNTSGHYTAAQVWTDESYQELGAAGWSQPTKHGYGRKPAVIVRNELNVEDFWTDGRGRQIVDCNWLVNDTLTDFNNNAVYQSFSVPVLVGPLEADVSVGPGQPLKFSSRQPGEGLSFAAPDWSVEKQIAHVRDKVDALLEAERIPKTAMRLDGTAASGVQVVAENLPLAEYREARKQVMVPVERELADVTLLLLDAHEEGWTVAPGDVDFQLVVDYQSVAPPISQAEDIARWTFDLEHGLVHPWEILMERDPDRWPSEEAAREWWIKHQEGALEVASSAPALGLRAIDAADGMVGLEQLMGQGSGVPAGAPADPAAPSTQPVPGSSTGGASPAAGAPPVEKAADAALNGAQVSALLEIGTAVAEGRIPREMGVRIIARAFLMPEPEADALLGDAGQGFEPTKPEPAPSPFGGPPAPKPDEPPPEPKTEPEPKEGDA